MLSQLHEHDDVEITLRDKSTARDHVVSIDRDGTVKFKNLGYRYRSGMEFHDHPSKKDIVEIKATGVSNEPNDPDMPELVSDDELVKECNRLTAENAKLKEKIADLEFEIKALKANTPKKTTKKSKKTDNVATAKDTGTEDTKEEGETNENTAAGETGNSPEEGAAQSN